MGPSAGVGAAEKRNISCPHQEYNQIPLLSILSLIHCNDGAISALLDHD